MSVFSVFGFFFICSILFFYKKMGSRVDRVFVLLATYYSANEEWQSRDILFTIAEYIVQCYQ